MRAGYWILETGHLFSMFYNFSRQYEPICHRKSDTLTLSFQTEINIFFLQEIQPGRTGSLKSSVTAKVSLNVVIVLNEKVVESVLSQIFMLNQF